MKSAGMLLLVLSIAGCERGVHDMYDQPHYRPGDASPLFADGAATRPPAEGTVAHGGGTLAQTSSGRRGRLTPERPPAVTEALLRRGRERYGIHCAPCHGLAGDGDGIVVQRGFPSPPSYHTGRLRDATDQHLYDVITQGYGVMHPYRERIGPQDRWAIVAYVRALQGSRHMPMDKLDDHDKTMLDHAGASP
ncbi:c-type cytochrome [Dyella jiangningensis]|nr:cytochrome c [Dyella jiangningensis]